MGCPQCSRIIFRLDNYLQDRNPDRVELLVYPRSAQRPPVPPSVPKGLGADYREACLVLADSPKASAALSRRCLQIILREQGGSKAYNLAEAIDEVLEQKALPSYLGDAIDAVRNLGNFAAHPMKSTNTGEILDVEPGEAEWLLDTLEGLFDFYFVQPALLQRKKDALNAKLKDAGKPQLKGSDGVGESDELRNPSGPTLLGQGQ